jgi:colanic acid/amylovoran biosynthesis glycosyltransferase
MNPDEFAFRDRVRRTAEPMRILTVGRLVEKKGVEYAIRAVAQARERGLEVHYDIVGDGPLRQALSSLIDELGVRQHVVLHGARDSRFIREAMSEAHLFMLTSVTAANGDQEGTPNSLIEAQATGLPVVSTRHSGIPEAVLDGKSGVLVAERDVAALTAVLLRLAAQPDVCREMGRKGRRHVEAQFDIRKLNRDMVGLYEEVHASARFVKRAWLGAA